MGALRDFLHDEAAGGVVLLALVGRRTSAGAKLFMLTIAIVDDVLAIVVIALVYSGPLAGGWLLVALGSVVVVAVMRRFVASPWAYVPVALVLWLAMLES